jgi:hypothetical protein
MILKDLQYAWAARPAWLRAMVWFFAGVLFMGLVR